MEITTHAPGTFCWFELGTTDAEAAKTFYTPLFGWTDDEMSTEMGPYVLLKKDDKEIGALYGLTDEQQAKGVPPHWLSYVAVEDVDATIARAQEFGGEVLMGPHDVYDHGRMAMLKDPTGAPFAVWQARKHPGAELVGAPGSVCWNELATRDAEAAGTFYTELFGWKRVEQEMDMGIYTTFMRDEKRSAGGMMEMTEEWGDAPPHWMAYFAVDDCDATAEQVEAVGGTVCVPPTDIPDVGRFAVIDDPQGAGFSIIQLVEMA